MPISIKTKVLCWRDWKSCKDYSFLFTTSRKLTDAEARELDYELLDTIQRFAEKVGIHSART